MNNQADIRTLKADAAALLKEMVAIPSPSFGEDAVCTHISAHLTSKEIVHDRIGNNIIAESSRHRTRKDALAPDAVTILLCAHIDTVTPGPDYSFDPHTPDYAKAADAVAAKVNGALSKGDDGYMEVCPEDIVAGLGSNDDGASAVAMIAAFRHFCGMEDKPSDVNPVLVLTCEEERSGKGGMTALWQEIRERYGKNVRAIVGEPTGMKAATSERGLLVIDAEAQGVSGHAARNEGVNALYIATEDIETLRRHKFGKISPRMGEVHINVTQINAGTAHNVIPDRCTFVIDIRPTEKYTNREILDELQAICRSRLVPRNLHNRSSATFEDSPLLKTAEALGIGTFSSPTTSDWMRIDCDAIKMGPGDSARSHRKDEFVFVREIEEGIDTYIRFLTYARKDKKPRPEGQDTR